MIIRLFALTAAVALAASVPAQATVRSADSRQPGSSSSLQDVQAFAGQIEVLGDARYGSAFAGDQMRDGQLVVYAVPRGSHGFLRALAAMDRRHLGYRVSFVRISYDTQAVTGGWITSHLRLLQTQGIDPSFWNPNPSGDDVLLALQGAGPRQYRLLRDALRREDVGSDLHGSDVSVSGRSYRELVTGIINSEAPSPIISLVPRFVGVMTYAAASQARPANSSYSYKGDERPFYAGDSIAYTLGNSEWCTSNVGVKDSSGAEEVLTAGHCSNFTTTGEFYTCATANSENYCNYNVGPITNLYKTNDDFEYLQSTVAADMWEDGNGTYWKVDGDYSATEGDLLTTDGSVSNAENNLEVYAAGGNDACFTETNPDTGATHEVCNDVILQANYEFIDPGDSGGPMVGVNSGGVKAVGMILSSGETDGVWLGCGEQIPHILSEAHLTLLTS
jgi:hypothetical protein